MKKYTLFVILVGTLILPLLSSANEMYLDPDKILERINQNGPDSVFQEFREDSKKWNCLIKQIESGERKWLLIATKLTPATDAGSTEMLILAYGVALSKKPENVLYFLSWPLDPEGVCGYPDMSDPRYETKEKTIDYLETRINAVRSVKNKELSEVKKMCLKCLKQTKKEVESPDGPFR